MSDDPDTCAARGDDALAVNLGRIDRDSAVPPFEQIANALRGAITSGRLAAGQRLPTETKLAEQFGVARTTVRRAVRELRYDGLLIPASGRVMTVRPGVSEATPQLPDSPAAATPKGVRAWDDAAPLIAQAEESRTRLHALAREVSEWELLVSDPAMAATLVRTLADIGLAQAAEAAALRTALAEAKARAVAAERASQAAGETLAALRTDWQRQRAEARSDLDAVRATHAEHLAHVQRSADDRVAVLTEALNAEREMLRALIRQNPTGGSGLGNTRAWEGDGADAT